MKLKKNAAGLYVFPIRVPFKDTHRIYNGLVDTGSTICASTYKIITTLRLRPTSFKKVANPMKEPIRALGYSMTPWIRREIGHDECLSASIRPA